MPEKEHFLSFYRNLFELEHGFDELEDEFARSLDWYNQQVNDTTDLWPPLKPEFSDTFMAKVSPLLIKIDDWLATLPVEQQQKEAESLLKQIEYYHQKASNHTFKRYYQEDRNWLYNEILLSEQYPIVNDSLQVLASSLKKYLPKEQIDEQINPAIKKINFTIQKNQLGMLFLGLKELGIIHSKTSNYELAKFLESNVTYNYHDVSKMETLFSQIINGGTSFQVAFEELKVKLKDLKLPLKGD